MNQHEQLQQAAKFALEVLLWTQAGEPVPSMECEAIKQLKTALQEPVEEHERWCASVTQLLLCDPPRKAPCNCKKKVAEPVQEPVAWQCREHGDTEWFDCGKDAYGINPRRYTYRALYTAPPQRKPLTEEEIKDCETQAMVNGALPFEQRVFFARAIEQQHGIV